MPTPYENGVTRREFERLTERVEVLYDKGSPKSAVLEAEIKALREALNGQGISLRDAINALNSRIENATKSFDADVTHAAEILDVRIKAIDEKVDKRLSNQNKLLWAIFIALVVGLIGIIGTLASGALSGGGM